MRQHYEDYTAEDQLVWQMLFDRQMKILPNIAEKAYLDGIKAIGFESDHIPNFEQMNQRLAKITGWEVVVVAGLIPAKEFFELLAMKKFPASTWLRRLDQLDYLEEPDMFHDVFAHVPLLTNHDFCNFLKGLSQIALQYIDNAEAIEKIARIYWYTVEFGLIKTANQALQIYGAGILSSSSESLFSVQSNIPERLPYQVEVLAETTYIKDKFQVQYFVIDSYQQLYESLPEIAKVIEKQVLVKA